jgi:hypothetical protein
VITAQPLTENKDDECNVSNDVTTEASPAASNHDETGAIDGNNEPPVMVE